MSTATAIQRAFESVNELDSNQEPANVVDVLAQLARATEQVATSIMPIGTAPGPCPSGGGVVGSLTEAVMGATSGLVQIAEAISDLASAVREHADEA